MKKVKLFALFLVMMMVVSVFTGCGKSNVADDSGNKAAGQATAQKSWTGTISIWDGPRWPDAQDNKYHWLESKKAEFEKSHPGVTIDIVQKPWEDLVNALNIAISGHAWPDISAVDISTGAVNLKQVKDGVIEPMDQYMTKEELADFYPNALDAYKVDGKLYGMPTALTIHAMMLNLDIFKEMNVEPPKDGKWTFSEFRDTMKKLTNAKHYGFSTYILPGYYESWPFFYINGGRPLSADMKKYTFDDPKVASAVQQLADLKLVDKSAPTEMGGADVGGTWKAFAAPSIRTVAVEPWASWAIQAAQGEKYKTNFMVAEYPTGDTGKPITISGVGGWVMYKQDDAAKKAVVAEFVKYISSTDDQVTAAKNYGVFPTRKSAAALNPFADNPQMAAAQKLTEYGVAMPNHTEWKKIDEAIQKQLQLVFNGEKTAAQALKDARPEVEALLNK